MIHDCEYLHGGRLCVLHNLDQEKNHTRYEHVIIDDIGDL